MVGLPRDRLLLRSKIEQQHNTIAALKQDGHETKDAERHLTDLEAELRIAESSGRKSAGDNAG